MSLRFFFFLFFFFFFFVGKQTNKTLLLLLLLLLVCVFILYYKEKSLSRFFWGLCVQRCSFFVCVFFVLVGEKAKKERDRPTDDDDVFF